MEKNDVKVTVFLTNNEKHVFENVQSWSWDRLNQEDGCFSIEFLGDDGLIYDVDMRQEDVISVTEVGPDEEDEEN